MADQSFEYLLIVEQEKASRLLDLLREIEEWVAVCPICLIRLKDHPFQWNKKADDHSDICKLAKELADAKS